MTALEHHDSTLTCPDCGAPTEPGTVTQPALLRHGGYGADLTTVVRCCTDCRWFLCAEITETKPLRRDPQ